MLNFVVFQNFDGFLLTLWRFYCVCFGQSIETIVDGFTKDLKEMIGKGLGFVGDDFKVSSFDFKDARVGNSVAYEFELEIDNQVFPLKFLENAKQWEYVDLPIFQIQEHSQQEDKNFLAQKRNLGYDLPVLAPFQLAGPMELWIQDADGMRVSLPVSIFLFLCSLQVSIDLMDCGNLCFFRGFDD